MSNEKVTTLEEVEVKIAEWHEKSDIKVGLHTYLGWTKEEYNKYMETQELPSSDLRPIND